MVGWIEVSGLIQHPVADSRRSNLKELRPLARCDSLIVKELPDETLVYDLRSSQAHCLNLTAARVWKNCDGERTVAQLVGVFDTEGHAVVSEEIIWLALAQLEKFDLLEIAPAKPKVLAMNRRELARSIGIGAILLPMILTITVPTALAQASGCRNDPCNSPSDCCPSNPDCKKSKCK